MVRIAEYRSADRANTRMARHAGDARQYQSIDALSTGFDGSLGITAEIVRDSHSARCQFSGGRRAASYPGW
jgi:hypothetical protein